MVQAGLLGVLLGLTPAWVAAQGTAQRFEVTNYVITAELLPSQHFLTSKARMDIVPNSDITALDF